MLASGANLDRFGRALAKFADADAKFDGWTMLAHACVRRRLDIVRCLLDKRADPNLTVLPLSDLDDSSGRVTRLFLQHGYNVHEQTLGAPIVDACRWGMPRVARLLIEHGAEPNFVYKYEYAANGLTPLMTAVLNQRTACIRVLLAAGADPNLGCRGFPSLETMRSLLESKQLPEIFDEYGSSTEYPCDNVCTPLIVAVASANVAAVKALVGGGACRGCPDSHGKTGDDYLSLVSAQPLKARIFCFMGREKTEGDSQTAS
jgi:hypothetical protein